MKRAIAIALGVVGVALALLWLVSTVERSGERPPDVQPPHPTRAAPISAPLAPAPALKETDTRFGVDGMTRIGETPTAAQVGAWSVGGGALVAPSTRAATSASSGFRLVHAASSPALARTASCNTTGTYPRAQATTW